MLKIDLSKQAIEFLDELSNKQSKQIVYKIDLLALNSNAVPTTLIKDGNGERRIRLVNSGDRKSVV